MNKMHSTLESKVALITGAAGGMGSQCALTYAKEGASLALIDINKKRLEKISGEVEDIGRKVLPITIDVSDEESVRNAVDSTVQFFGRIDILVNIAGHQGPGSSVWEVEPRAWLRTFEVNLWGMFLFCRYVIPYMVKRKIGKIINVTSGAGNDPMPFFSGYAASKAGANHFTRTIAEELKPYGINVNAMGVRGITQMWRDVLDAGPGGGTTTASIRSQVEAGMNPKVEENLPVFMFLASSASDHVTGQYIEANSLPAYVIAQA
jgi:NAD(P)-dependent dehydrogenase (short-subunit alcohol dehydrogenase family)